MTTLRYQLSSTKYGYGYIDELRADKTDNRLSEGSIKQIFEGMKKDGWEPPTPTVRKILRAFQLTQGGDGRSSCESLAMVMTSDIRQRFGDDFVAVSFSIIQNRIDEIQEARRKK